MISFLDNAPTFLKDFMAYAATYWSMEDGQGRPRLGICRLARLCKALLSLGVNTGSFLQSPNDSQKVLRVHCQDKK